MKQFNNRAICNLLRTLKHPELKEFENYLSFQGENSLMLIWNLLRKNHPNYNISDEKVFHAAFPDKAFKDNTFRVYVTKLYKMAKEYVAYLHFKQNKYLFHNTMAQALVKRKDEKTYLKEHNKIKKLYQENQPKFTEQFLFKFQMEDCHYQYMTKFHQLNTTNSLQKAADSHDLSFLAIKLRYFISMRTRKRVTGEKYRYEMEEEVLEYIARNDFSKEPIIHLYHLLVCLFKDMRNRSLFNAFTTYFESNMEKIGRADARQMLTTATNIAYWNIQMGYLEFLDLRFNLIKIMVKDEFTIVNGILPEYHFRNIIRAAILAGKINWATSFLEENIHKTSDRERDNIATFNRALLHFSRGEYELQSPYMQRMAADFEFTDTYSNLRYRLLAIETSYERLSTNPSKNQHFKSLMNAFRLFVMRQKEISENFRSSCTNFHKTLNLIFNWKYGIRVSKANETIKAEILTVHPLVELPWLLKQLS